MIIDSPIISGSYAASGSLNQLGNVVISGSLTVTGSIIGTASYSETASYLSGYVSPFPFTGSAIISGSLEVTGSANLPNITGSLSGSLQGTASYAVTASNAVTASYLTGYVSPFPFTGSAVISGSLGVTGSLQVTNLSGSGVRYLVADESGSVTAQSASAALKSTQAFTSTAGQTTFSVTNGYATGYVDVFINGSKLSTAEFTDTSGTNIVLATGSFDGDTVEVVKYTPAAGVTNNVLRQLTTLTGSAGQTVFSASYTPGLLDIYYNGSRLSTSDYTANNGTYFTLATGSADNDILDVLVYSYQVGAFNGIGGAGVPTQIAYFNTTSSITGSNNFTIDGSTMTVTGSLVVSGSGTFTNIGPAVFSGSITALQGISGTASLASTASSADNFLVRNTLTAQTLVVQTITSSVDYVTGSTRFGSIAANTHTFTGSVITSGSVGIGTTPAHNLTLVGGQTTPGSFSAGNYTFGIYSGSVSTVLRETFAIGSDASYIYMQSFSSRPLYINRDGNNIILGSSAASVNVGVNNVSPSNILTISSGDGTFIKYGDNGYLGQYSNGAYIMGGGEFNSAGTWTARHTSAASIVVNNAGAGNILFNTNTGLTTGNTFGTTERMRITSGGNVGIGTSSPSSQLSIVGAGSDIFADGLRVTRASGTNQYGVINYKGGSLNLLAVDPVGSSPEINFLTSTNGSTSSVRMVILSSGNVGIGTSSPGAPLHIALSSSAASGETLRLVSKDSIGDVYQTFYRYDGTTRKGYLGYGYGAQDYFEIHQEENSDIIISTNATERMRITAGGLTTLSGPTLSSNTQGTYALQIGEPGYNNLTLGYKQATAGYIQTWASTALYLNQQGNAAYAGAVRLDTLSDERIKDNIQPITGCLDKVLQLNGKKFHLKDEPEDKVRYGFIAQELEGILDEFVIQTDMTFTKDDLVVENVKSIENWASSWAALLVEAIKEQQALIQSLQEKLERNNII